jgi:hypothetical protein
MIEQRIMRYWVAQWFALTNAMTAWWLVPLETDS